MSICTTVPSDTVSILPFLFVGRAQQTFRPKHFAKQQRTRLEYTPALQSGSQQTRPRAARRTAGSRQKRGHEVHGQICKFVRHRLHWVPLLKAHRKGFIVAPAESISNILVVDAKTRSPVVYTW